MRRVNQRGPSPENAIPRRNRYSCAASQHAAQRYSWHTLLRLISEPLSALMLLPVRYYRPAPALPASRGSPAEIAPRQGLN